MGACDFCGCGWGGVRVAQDGVRPRSLVDETRRVMRLRRYSIRTEEAYVQWIRRFIRFSGGRHPPQCGGLSPRFRAA